MKNALSIIFIVSIGTLFVMPAIGAEGEGYDVTIAEKTDMFMDKDKIATIPELALFRALKIRDDWVFGTYKDVETEQVYTGWIQKKFIGDLDKMYEALKAESENYLLDGERRFQEGRYDEAIRLLTESLDRHPAQPHALWLRAQSFLALTKKAQALQDYSTIIRIAPGSEEAPDALLSRAKLLMDAKNYQAAVKDLEQVLKTQPDNAEAYLYLGNIQFYQRRYQNALAFYEKGLETGTTISAFYHQRGMTYFYLNMFDESRADLEKAIEMNKENADYRRSLAYVNQQVKLLESITPQEIRKILEVKVTQRDGKLLVSLKNISTRPLLNVEVAMVAFIEDTFKKAVETREPFPSKEPTKSRGSEKNVIEPLKIEVQGIKFFPGVVRGSNANMQLLEGQSFSEELKEKGRQYFGCIVIVFVNKQEIVLRSDPKSLKDEYNDTLLDMYVEVQGEEMK